MARFYKLFNHYYFWMVVFSAFQLMQACRPWMVGEFLREDTLHPLGIVQPSALSSYNSPMDVIRSRVVLSECWMMMRLVPFN